MYASNEAYFEAVKVLIVELRETGNEVDSSELDDGFHCINGLTDGWAQFLDSLPKLEQNREGQLSESQAAAITNLCETAYQAVYRKKRSRHDNKPSWKFW